jgi:hypothetical protein
MQIGGPDAEIQRAQFFAVRWKSLCTPGMSKVPSLSGGVNLWGESTLYINPVFIVR